MPNSVSAIPEGYHALTPSLTCKDAASAMDFYKKVFNAQEIMRMAGARWQSHARRNEDR
ncbi:MAG: hypothetical protein NVS9B4_22740 [Candidatus Acidiferrum sp.]